MGTPVISDHMVRYPYVILPDQSVSEAKELMQDLGIRHLPVVNEGRLLGIVSERDLKEAGAEEVSRALPVRDIMKTDVYIVGSRTPLSEVAADMADEKVGSAVIVDDELQVIGIFTTIDALRILSERLQDDEHVESYFDGLDEFEDGLRIEINN